MIESTQTLSDGNTINRKVQTNMFRDSQGRTRRETTLPAVGPLAASGQPKTFIMIFDPVATTSYVLHPDTKIADKLPTPPGGGKNSANFEAKFEARMQQEIANGTLKKDDLGTQSINGLSAQGTRYTRTIPAGQVGNDKLIIVVSERWYSPDLQIVVKSTPHRSAARPNYLYSHEHPTCGAHRDIVCCPGELHRARRQAAVPRLSESTGRGSSSRFTGGCAATASWRIVSLATIFSPEDGAPFSQRPPLPRKGRSRVWTDICIWLPVLIALIPDAGFYVTIRT